MRQYGSAGIGRLAYLGSDFLSALFENWESKFLQMSAYVLLMATQFQQGRPSQESPMIPNDPTMNFPSGPGASVVPDLGL